jgi:DNA-binding NtrC family response regulator
MPTGEFAVMPTKTRVFIVSTDEKEAEYLAGILPEDRFELKAFPHLEELTLQLRRSDCRLAILDVDSVPLTSRDIRHLKRDCPKVTLFCTSMQRLHPELQEALSHDICACLNKPVDSEELQFWLKSVRTSAPDSKAPP